MKVAILTPTFYKYSGPDRVAENEAKEYADKGDEVVVFTFKGDIKPDQYKVVKLGMPSNATVERLYRLFFFLDIYKVVKVSKMLQEFDEIVSFLYPMTILGSTAKKYRRKRYVYYNVGVAYPKLFGSVFEKTYMKLFNIFTNFSVRNADSAISISDFLRKELVRETGIESKVKYVKVDSKMYNKTLSRSRIADVIRKHYMKKPVILYVGRLSPHKGVHLLLEAFKIVREQIPNATLVIVGKETFGRYGKRLKRIAPEGVVFTGFVPDEELPYYFGACDVYATGTLWEGFDIPAVQAQMCGKKVIAFNVGSHPEVVKNGILVKEGDLKGFAEAVVNTLKNQPK